MNARALLSTLVTFAAFLVLQFLGVEMSPDVQEGFIIGGLLLYGMLATDAKDVPVFKQPTTITALIGAVLWLVTVIFKIEISNDVKMSVAGAIIAVLGLYSETPKVAASLNR